MSLNRLKGRRSRWRFERWLQQAWSSLLAEWTQPALSLTGEHLGSLRSSRRSLGSGAVLHELTEANGAFRDSGRDIGAVQGEWTGYLGSQIGLDPDLLGQIRGAAGD